MTETVMDSSAVLASIHGEPGADVVDAALAGSVISAINFAEVVSKLIFCGLPEAEAVIAARRFGAGLVDVDEDQAVTAGMIHASTREAGISMADAFCLALAKQRGSPVLTSDRAWKTLGLGIEVTLIR
jgi:PIN domain nuclease of toxin-antitoxin system